MAKLSLVGVGPGDPELLTLRAAKTIAQAEIIAYIHTPNEQSLALRIAQDQVRAEAAHLPVRVDMNIALADRQSAYDDAVRKMKFELSRGKSVVFLCEGDPLFYGSAISITSRMAPDEIEIVPGISSPFAAAAAAKMPMAKQNETFKTVPATLKENALQKELASPDPITLIKVGRHVQKAKKVLAQHNRLVGAKIVEFATIEDKQKISDLQNYDAETAPYFSLILVPAQRDERNA